MKTFNRVITLAIAPLTVGTMLFAAVPAYAATTSTSDTTACTVQTVGTKDTAGDSDSRFTLNGNGTVSAVLVIKGDSSCTQTVTITSWEAPNALKGLPYSEQTVFAHTTETFSVGTYNISVALPNCYYQVDLIPGSSPTGPNNSPVYPTGTLLGSLHGGVQTCVQTPPTTTPPTTTKPTTPKTTTQQPTALPNTGPGSAPLAIGITAAILGTAYSYTRRLRGHKSL